jgi:SAM-dependent methyltransferase
MNDQKTFIDKHNCPVCGSNERNIILNTIDRHYNIKGSWNIGMCNTCGLVQLTPMLSATELIKLYPEDNYYAYDINKHKQFFKKLIKTIFLNTLIVRDPKFTNPGKVLDYGCGTGWSLIDFKNKNWICKGIEPSKIASKIGREQLGLEIVEGTIHTINLGDEKFTYIRANHSLEHDPDINETIAMFSKYLENDGKLLIGVPNIKSIPYQLFGRYWWYLGAPVHTYNFTTDLLSKLLNKHGFQIDSVRYCGNYAGILGSIQMYLNRGKKNQNPLKGFLMNFPPFIIIAQLFAVIFNLMKKGDAIEIIATKK